MTEFFIPFLNWFALSGLSNPWDFFYKLGQTRMFPYPTAMLAIMAFPRLLFSPFFPGDWQTVTAFHLFMMRLPLLLFDAVLCFQILKLFPTQPRKVLLIYWCSPIVFFINYVHGQLDIIPTAIFFSGLLLLLRSRYLAAFLLFALAAATKSHVLIALPFIGVFLFKKRLPLWRLAGFFALFTGVYFLLLLPYLGSEGFRQMVFNSPEQKKFFDFVIPVSSSLKLVVCPTVVMLLFIKFASYKKLNREILLMFLGIVFACLVVFVPPMPGWFLWSLPFLVYFYIHNKEYSRAPFVIYNAVYMIYFLFFFEKDPPFLGRTSLPVRDLALSVVMSSVGFIALWMFHLGVRKNEELRIAEAPLLIGIGGDSASGKHTLLAVLRNLVGKSRSIPILGDNFHKWERGDEHWSVYTHLNPSANRLHESMELAVALKDGRAIEMVRYDHASGKFTNPAEIEPSKFIFFVGLHPFYLKQMRDMMAIKIFMEPEEKLRQLWKTRRDVARRGYKPGDVARQLAAREEDRARHVLPQKDFADLVIRYAVLEFDEAKSSESGKIPFKTVYRLDNSVNLGGLAVLLAKIPTLQVEHISSVHEQELHVQGTLKASEVMTLAYDLGFNFDELGINPKGWLKNHNGVSQLVFLLLYNHKMKAR